MMSAMMTTIMTMPTPMMISFGEHVELPIRRCADKACGIIRITSAIVLWHFRVSAQWACHDDVASVVFRRHDLAGTTCPSLPMFREHRRVRTSILWRS